jgi:hypothetical protein
MTIVERGDGSLVVTYDSTRLTRLMLVLAAALLLVAAYDVFVGTRGTDRLVGLIAASGTCLLIALVFLERVWFQFAADTHILTWRRRWALRERSGSIPFDSIESVIVERPIGDDGTPSRRIVLKSESGEMIPITVGYRPDADGIVLQIADKIRARLGHNTGATHMRNVKALVAAGRNIDAIRVLREEEGLTLVDAKRRVDELRESREG